MRQFETPMMRQYINLKKQYDDCLLFYRLGDFYELFLEDAEIGAKVLDITLTSRSRGKDGKIPMAGVPYHAVNSYLSKLVKAGYKVAICEQVGKSDGKNLVERQVVRIVTPGTLLDENSLNQKQNNFILALSKNNDQIGLALTDVSTGRLQAGEIQTQDLEQAKQKLANQLANFHISEVILKPDLYNDPRWLELLKQLGNFDVFCFHEWTDYAQQAPTFLKNHFHLKSLQGFTIGNQDLAKKVTAALLGYLKATQQSQLNHIETILPLSRQDTVRLNRSTITNLELFKTIRENKTEGSLINLLDQTKTALGGRLLREWLVNPLQQESRIQARLDAVEKLTQDFELRQNLEQTLNQIYDIERILSKLSVGIATPKDVVRLKQSLQHATELKNLGQKANSQQISSLAKQIKPTIKETYELIDQYLIEDPVVDPKDGGVIKAEVDPKLSKLKKLIRNNKQWLTTLEQEERRKTKISSLKVEYNKVYGFYIEISKANLDNVPDHYQRKQTLVNSERFFTDELKQKEEEIISAQEKANQLEYELFFELTDKILTKLSDLKQAAQAVAELDCLVNFAQLAQELDWVKPKLKTGSKLEIKAGRHPVVEQAHPHENFVPNDTQLDNSHHQLMVITGPNMAGKSVYIRQVALITLLTQIGSFVPADKACISLVDQIFVRSGASDVITSGLSTFMVEMVEAAYILNNATEKSLIVMDEIGRGTSTYDGISLAWAVAEYLVKTKNKQAKTLFATHYHELQELEDHHPDRIKNYQLCIIKDKGEPVFLHKLKRGGADHSFGIAVAKIAGVPKKVTDQAQQKLTKLENQSKKEQNHILNQLKTLQVDKLTPLEALNQLAQLQQDLLD